MRDLQNYFVENVQVPLFHYTGISSLLGMVETNAIWATSISYLNDSEEILHACELIKSEIQERKSEHESDLISRFYSELTNWIDKLSKSVIDIYIISFSENPFLLSQWRSYTPHGKGVCIEFNKVYINKLLSNSRMKFAKCVYDIEEQRNIVQFLLDMIWNEFEKYYQTGQLKTLHPNEPTALRFFFDIYQEDICQVLAITKNNTFREEKEWRLISPLISDLNINKVHFRDGSLTLTPYIKIPLEKSPTLFKDIYLGPTPYHNLAMSSFIRFVTSNKVANGVINTLIPYRE